MTRSERLVLWLLDVSCRAREAAYAIAPTDERKAAWRRAEESLCAHDGCAFDGFGPEPTDPEERDEKPWDETRLVRCGDVIRLVDADDESMVSHVFGPGDER